MIFYYVTQYVLIYVVDFTKKVYFYDTIKRKAIDSNGNPSMSPFFSKYLQ